MKKISVLSDSNADGVGGFTYGSLKNVSAPGVYDGTPFEADWQNDIQALHQRILTEGEIVPNGTNDTPATSQLYTAMLYAMRLKSDLTVTVGSGGNYATVNLALEAISKMYIVQYSNTRIRITINMLAGYVFAEQLIIDGINFGNITITGADSTTMITRSALTIGISVGDTIDINTLYPAFAAVNGGVLPVIDQVFQMDISGTANDRCGLITYGAGSSATIAKYAGFTYCQNYAILAADCSSISAENTELSSIYDGTNTYSAVAAAIDGGRINCRDSNLTNTTNSEFLLYAKNGSTITADNVTAGSAANTAVKADGASTINVNNSTITNANGRAVWAKDGSTINMGGSTATTSGGTNNGVMSEKGSTINANSATADEFVIFDGSFINASNATGTLLLNGGGAATANTLYADGVIWK